MGEIMSNHEFENYLALVSRLMRLTTSQKSMIRDELRDHLENRVSELVESGFESHDAMRRALEEFGDAAMLANKFQSVFQLNQRRWMMRFATFSIAGTFVVAVLIMAMWPSDAKFGSPNTSVAQEDPLRDSDNEVDQDPFATASANPADPFVVATVSKASASAKEPIERSIAVMTNEQVEKLLRQPISVNYDEVPFNDVMEAFLKDWNLNTILDQSASDDSLTEDELISFRIRNVRLGTALRLMLKEKNATYVIDDGILRIISFDVAADPEYFRRKMFDCRSLLAKIAKTDAAKSSRWGGGFGGASGGGFGGASGGGGGVQGGGSGKGGGVFCVTCTLAQEKASESCTAETVAQQQAANNAIRANEILNNLIRTTVSPESWDDTNGDGTMVIVGGFLVVVQDQQTLEQIEEFVIELDTKMQ